MLEADLEVDRQEFTVAVTLQVAPCFGADGILLPRSTQVPA